MQGLIVENISNMYKVKAEDKIYESTARGKFKKEDITPVVGDMVEFGGLLGYAPVMPVNSFSCEAFVSRKGRIPAPIHSFKN